MLIYTCNLLCQYKLVFANKNSPKQVRILKRLFSFERIKYPDVLGNSLTWLEDIDKKINDH